MLFHGLFAHESRQIYAKIVHFAYLSHVCLSSDPHGQSICPQK